MSPQEPCHSSTGKLRLGRAKKSKPGSEPGSPAARPPLPPGSRGGEQRRGVARPSSAGEVPFDLGVPALESGRVMYDVRVIEGPPFAGLALLVAGASPEREVEPRNGRRGQKRPPVQLPFTTVYAH